MTNTQHPQYHPLRLEWQVDGATVTGIVKGAKCECLIEVVIGIVDVMDTPAKIANLAQEGGKLTIQAMTEIFEAHIDNPVMVAISAMTWLKTNAEAFTKEWTDALVQANENAKTHPATAPADIDEYGVGESDITQLTHKKPSVRDLPLRPRTPPGMWS